MTHSSKKIALLALGLTVAVAILLTPMPRLSAADHAEAPSVAGDPGADIADVYFFLDPNDNSRATLAMDVEGFVVPSELLNLSLFAPDVTFRFEIENTGDARPDQAIDVTFSPQTSRSTPQTATITLPGGRKFTAPTTVPTFTATPPDFVVTRDAATGVSFFAGLTDDPFFFDIVGANRFISSILAGSPDLTRLQRGRDSFAGYNIHMITLSVPVSMLRGSAGNIVGVDGVTLRNRDQVRLPSGELMLSGPLVQVDRMATPAVNTLLIPYPRKNEYNASTPVDDAAGKFAGDIVATLKALGTTDANVNVLAGVAVTKGDYLRLDLSVANTSVGEGLKITDAGYAGFPNGRRPGDDVVDTLLYFVANRTPIGDNVNGNDRPFGRTFPFFAPSHQPLQDPAACSTRN